MKKDVEKRPEEASFTLLEVIIAVGLLTAVVIQMATGQGTIFSMVDYGQRSTQAIWLAKRVMTQVEYNWNHLDFKDMETNSTIKDQVFRDITDPDFEYRWSLEVHEWKLPIFDLLAGGGPKSKKDGEKDKQEETPENAGGGSALAGMEDAINKVFEGQILKVARVEVSWPDGARRSSVSLTYLLTNQKKLDEYITLKKATFDQVIKQATPLAAATPNPSDPNNPNGTGTPNGTPGTPGTATPGAPGAPGATPANGANPANPQGNGAVPGQTNPTTQPTGGGMLW